MWPGQFVDARLLLETRPHALTVPMAAIQHGPDGLYVYVVKPDSTVALQDVKMAQQDQGIAVIEQGMDDGAQVVVSGSPACNPEPGWPAGRGGEERSTAGATGAPARRAPAG